MYLKDMDSHIVEHDKMVDDDIRNEDNRKVDTLLRLHVVDTVKDNNLLEVDMQFVVADNNLLEVDRSKKQVVLLDSLLYVKTDLSH